MEVLIPPTPTDTGWHVLSKLIYPVFSQVIVLTAYQLRLIGFSGPRKRVPQFLAWCIDAKKSV